jgi:hypothetical protein
MITEKEKKVFDTLDELGIYSVRHEHEPVFTIEEGSKLDTGDGRHCKNLFLRNIKGDTHYLLIVAPLSVSTVHCTSEPRIWRRLPNRRTMPTCLPGQDPAAAAAVKPGAHLPAAGQRHPGRGLRHEPQLPYAQVRLHPEYATR